MSYAASLLSIGTLPSYKLGVESYDQDKLGLGPLMIQNNGGTAITRWAGPLPITLFRPMEAPVPIQVVYPWAMQWSNSTTSQIDWSFYGDGSGSAATRRLVAYTYDRLTGTGNYKGFVTVTFPTATNFTVRALRMTYDLHTTGTVAVSGTAVTGTSTVWLTDRACVGNRIGFGSTDPAAITTWHEISAIASDTSITLTANAGTISAGTPYVIEDLRAIIGAVNATTTNGGLFVVKGLNFDQFTSSGGTVPAAATTDNIRACYWLKSAATITETAVTGLGTQVKTSFTSQMCWLGSGTTTQQLFKFDIRAALTLTSGAATNAFQFSTSVSAALTGVASQANNGRVINLGHGPGAGVDCYYFTTTTRVYRTKDLSTVISGDLTFITSGDVMLEIPPGGTATSSAGSVMNSVDYLNTLDKLAICNTFSTAKSRNYITQYRTDSGALDREFGGFIGYLPQSTADSGLTPSISQVPSATGGMSIWTEGGLAYIVTIGSTAALNFIFTFPIGADWEYAATTNARIITPRIACQQANKFLSAYLNDDKIVGSDSGLNLGIPTEPYRVYYRTTGISDNSGSWTLIDNTGNLSSTAGTAYIQLMFEFRTMGNACIPARLHNIAIIYDSDDSLPAEMRWNLGDSDNTNGTIGVTQTTTFASLTTLTITYYRADNNAVVLTQDSNSTTNGNWQYHNGTTFVNGLGTNTANLRRRFVPTAGLPTGVDVYAKITAV